MSTQKTKNVLSNKSLVIYRSHPLIHKNYFLLRRRCTNRQNSVCFETRIKNRLRLFQLRRLQKWNWKPIRKAYRPWKTIRFFLTSLTSISFIKIRKIYFWQKARRSYIYWRSRELLPKIKKFRKLYTKQNRVQSISPVSALGRKGVLDYLQVLRFFSNRTTYLKKSKHCYVDGISGLQSRSIVSPRHTFHFLEKVPLVKQLQKYTSYEGSLFNITSSWSIKRSVSYLVYIPKLQRRLEIRL